jgi:hypothetical protein
LNLWVDPQKRHAVGLTRNVYTLFIRVVDNGPFPQHIYPDKGVAIKEHQLTLVFATVCTKGRKPWLTTDETRRLLQAIWTEAT